MDTALDRALHRPTAESPPVDWRTVHRIIARQSSPQTLQTSLERLAEEPLVPMPVFCFAVDKATHRGSGSGSGGVPDSRTRSNLLDYEQCLHRTIRNIWRRILVDRGTIAFHAASQMELRRPRANVAYEQQLLAIQSEEDLVLNAYFSTGFLKTKHLLEFLAPLPAQTNYAHLPTSPNSMHSFVRGVIQCKLPTFLIYIAAKYDPTSVSETDLHCIQGHLALHVALSAQVVCRRPSDPHRIRFSPPSENHHDAVSQKWLNLFQRQSPVYLLCHLDPSAARKRNLHRSSRIVSSYNFTRPHDSSSAAAAALNAEAAAAPCIPLEHFLYSLKNLPHLPVPPSSHTTMTSAVMHRLGGAPINHHNNTMGGAVMMTDELDRHVQPILQDLRRVLRYCPQVLETRHPQSRMWPFLIPMLWWDSYKDTMAAADNSDDEYGSLLFRTHVGNDGDSSRSRSRGPIPESSSSSSSSSLAQNFLLTLSYSLLRENPMVLSRSYDSAQVKFAPCTVYEKVLEERIEQTDGQLQTAVGRQENLQRQIEMAELRLRLLEQDKEIGDTVGIAEPGGEAVISKQTKRRRTTKQ